MKDVKKTKVMEYIYKNGGWKNWYMEEIEIMKLDYAKVNKRKKELIEIHKPSLNTITYTKKYVKKEKKEKVDIRNFFTN